jgi:hypothetical protein
MNSGAQNRGASWRSSLLAEFIYSLFSLDFVLFFFVCAANAQNPQQRVYPGRGAISAQDLAKSDTAAARRSPIPEQRRALIPSWLRARQAAEFTVPEQRQCSHHDSVEGPVFVKLTATRGSGEKYVA